MIPSVRPWLAAPLLAGALLAGCKQRRLDTPPPAPSAIGWRLDLPGEPLRGGRLVTTPPGREELLVPALPEASRRWARGCAGDTMALPREGLSIELKLSLAADGAIRSAQGSESGLASCLAAQAGKDRLAPVHLPSESAVSVVLLFAP